MKALDPPLEDEELVLVVVLLDESWVDVTVDGEVEDVVVVVVLLELLVVDDEEVEVLLLVELVELLFVDVLEVEDGEYMKVVVCTAVAPRPPHVAFTR